MADESTADWVRRMIAEHELRNYRQFLARLEPQEG